MLVRPEPSQVIVETLVEMFRPFGRIESWQVQCANDGLYRCSVRLDAPEQHSAIAQAIGAELNDDQLSLEIRVRQ